MFFYIWVFVSDTLMIKMMTLTIKITMMKMMKRSPQLVFVSDTLMIKMTIKITMMKMVRMKRVQSPQLAPSAVLPRRPDP